MEFRTEHDSMGEVKVPADALYGAQTQRSRENFKIGSENMPIEIIYALAQVKKACAIGNFNAGKLDAEKKNAICAAADEILSGAHDAQFPLRVWQTGSGTQTNMNVNEVIAHIAKKNGVVIHPNDHVNMSQSTNDVFPTAIHVAAVTAIEKKLLPAVSHLISTVDELAKENGRIIKCGRTHFQDAVPLTFGQEASSWSAALSESAEMIRASLVSISKLALGGTAVGTGLNAPKNFGEHTAAVLTELCGHEFITAENKFSALASKNAVVFSHGALKALAADLFKIANDIRFLASGPRCGIGEISLPENEPGSSIMPGKVNPTQCEMVTMVATEVMGNDAAIGFAASQGNLELNVFMPLIGFNLLRSVNLLADCVSSFDQNCVSGIKVNEKKMREYLERSLMCVTCLSPVIGYEKAAKTAQTAHKEGTSLREACVKLGFLTEEEFDKYYKPEEMI
ncbi:MAG: class II fumarate hydratase [Ruminococcaceae bacterium]|nr:class II fumarate hydratase [Oscillospiraceae bacterium]